MDTSILSTYDISSDVEYSISEIFDSLKKQFSVQFDTDFSFDVSQFSAFENIGLNYFGPVIKNTVGENSFYICFIELKVPEIGKSSTTLTYQIWGVLNLKQKYPHILIRTETFIDKIHELINPVELDFADNMAFSKNFFVLTDDKKKTELSLTPFIQNSILEIDEKEILIEIKESQLIIGNKKSLDLEFAIKISKFLDKLSRQH